MKACYEAYQLMDLTINLFESRKQNGEIDDILKSLAGFEDNFNFYNQFPEFRKEVPIFCVAMDEAASHEHLVIFENKLSSLEDLKDKNTDCVSDIFYVDLTINLWDIPFKVVKVVCPNHAQLSPLHQAPFLGSYTSDANLFLHYPNCFP